MNGSPPVTRAPAPTVTRKPTASGPGTTVPSGHRRILLALARYGACTKAKLAILSRYTSNGGGFNNNLSALRTGGCIVGTDPIEITESGLRDLGDFDPLPEDADTLFADWVKHPELGKAHREILRVLKEHGGPMTKDHVAANCDPPYEPGGGGFNNALSRLRTLGVIEGSKELQLSESLQ
jgi:hypothetical protein